jgi:hypothetical protein
MAGPPRKLPAPSPSIGSGLLLLVSPDEYLLELRRDRIVADWIAAHPDGEVVRLDPAPAAEHLVRELINPSLFAPTRLVLVPDARPYFPTPKRAKPVQEGEESDSDAEIPADTGSSEHRGDAVAKQLEGLTFRDVSLVLALAATQAPKGRLGEAIAAVGQVLFLPVPEAPKPWEHTRVSGEQRAVLAEVIAHVAPAVAADAEVVDALCETYGFEVRELAQAAARLATSGEITPEAVRFQAGPADCSLQHLEDALVVRDRAAVARLLGALSAGGVLLDWRGAAVAPGGVGPVLTATIGRLLRLGLAMRSHARRCGLEAELDPRRCAERFWYSNVYWSSKTKTGMHAKLAADAAELADSPLGADAKPWPSHRAFRLASCYTDRELVTALGALARCGAERARPHEVVAALTPLLLALTEPRGGGRKPSPAAGRPPVRQRSAPVNKSQAPTSR